MSRLTIFLSRLLGLYCILAALAMITHKRMILDAVTVILHNSPALYIVGVLTLIAGLAMILGHNVWSGGVLPVVVTLLGWITLIKALLFLFLSPEAEARLFLDALHYEQFFYLYAGISLLIGVYLTYAGFRSSSR